MPVLKKKPNSVTAKTQGRVDAEREKTAANVTAAVDEVVKELEQRRQDNARLLASVERLVPMVLGLNPDFCGQLRGLLSKIDEAMEQIIKQGRGRVTAILNDMTAIHRPPPAPPVQPTQSSESTALVFVLRSAYWVDDAGQGQLAMPYTFCQLPTRFVEAARAKGIVGLPGDSRVVAARQLVAAGGTLPEAVGSVDLDELALTASLPSGAEVKIGAPRQMQIDGPRL
jgi:hypothetical protein